MFKVFDLGLLLYFINFELLYNLLKLIDLFTHLFLIIYLFNLSLFLLQVLSIIISHNLT